MEAICKITQIENNLLTLRLPLSFKAKRVEVIVMPAEETVMSSEWGQRYNASHHPNSKAHESSEISCHLLCLKKIGMH